MVMQPSHYQSNKSTYGTEVALGNVDNARTVHKFGGASSVGTTMVPITSAKAFQTPAIPIALEILSDDNTNDVPGGAGALSVEVIGIVDWNLPEVTETVALNGTTPVPLTNSFLRVYRMKVASSGNYGTDSASSHDSTITLRQQSGGATWAVIESLGGFGIGQSEIGVYSIPAGKQVLVYAASVFVESTKSADVILFVRDNADVIASPYSPMQAKLRLRNVVDHIHLDPTIPIGPFIGPCDIGWMGAASSTTANIQVNYAMVVSDV